MTTMPYRRLLELRVLIPLALCLALAADVGLRFIPTRYFAYRGWEVVSRYHTADAPMDVNISYHNDREYGDLARMANLPEAREYRETTYTTDSDGFRNPPGDGIAPSILIFGTSMSAGAGLSDEQTLSARLSARLGVRVYNTAPAPADLDHIRKIARRQGMNKGVVLLEHLERDPIPSLTTVHGPNNDLATAGRLLETLGIEREARLAYNWYKVRPVSILTQSALRRLQDDRWLPNVYARQVLQVPMPDGTPMLFLGSILDDVQRPRDVRNVGYWSWLVKELRKDNLTLLVFLVPEKNTVYFPLLEPNSTEARRESYLNALASTLKANDISVVNLLPTFLRKARDGLARRTYLYRLDDTHWNPKGVDLAVDEICRNLPPN
jgi:hypothetical protein